VIRRFRSGLPVKGQGFSPGLWRWVQRGAGNADIVHVQNFHALTTFAVLRVATRPVVFTPHYLGAADGVGGRMLHRTYSWLIRRPARKVSRIVCVSSSELAEFARDVGFAKRCVVIPNGVDAQAIRAASRVSTSGRLLVVAGRLEPYKQHAVVLEALAQLPKDFRLAIIGDGSLRTSLQTRAAQLGVSDRVTVTGKLAPADLFGYYAAAEVVLSMSDRECFGLTIAEGLTAGASVVASDIGAHRDVVELAGAVSPQATLLPVGASAHDVAHAVLASPGRDAGGPATQLPDWRSVARDTAALYDAVIDTDRRLVSPGYAAG
jgi:glycosyltransferase involved in cell wall biosynthesis